MRKLVVLLAIFMLGCTSETIIDDVSSERVKKRNEIVLVSDDTSGIIQEYLQGLYVDLDNLPRGNIRNWNWFVFPNDVTGDMYFQGWMTDENGNLDFCRAQYPTNGTNGYYIACPLEYDTVYYLVLRPYNVFNDEFDSVIEIFIPR